MKEEKTVVELNGKRILITGVAGFIGFHLVQRLLNETQDSEIIGVDSITDYNPIVLKKWRLQQITSRAKEASSKWEFFEKDIIDREFIYKLFRNYEFSIVVNLAAQAGVRNSISNPDLYINSNIIGFYNILEACRNDRNIEHLIYASSSSVYGGNEKIPFSTQDKVDNPVSLYAATKKTDELLAYSYSKLYNIPATGLRFFTVYGPAGRTDMFYYTATEKLIAGKKIGIYNYGNCKRDFTYIDDIVEGVYRVMKGAPTKKIGQDGLPIPPHKIYNIGGEKPINLMDFIEVLQEELVANGLLPQGYDFDAYKEYLPMQPGDVPITYSDSKELKRDYDFIPSVDIRTGLRRFVEWYKEYKNCI